MPADEPYDIESHLPALEPFTPVGAIIVAHSTGCFLAAAFAASRPRRMAGLILTG